MYLVFIWMVGLLTISFGEIILLVMVGYMTLMVIMIFVSKILMGIIITAVLRLEVQRLKFLKMIVVRHLTEQFMLTIAFLRTLLVGVEIVLLIVI